MKTLLTTDISQAKEVLESDGLVAIPTETVYGMAANGLKENCVRSIFQVKNRPFYDPLILHSNSRQKFEAIGLTIPEALSELCDAYWPGPLTVLVDRSDRIPELTTSGLPKVAIRVPNHPLTLELLASVDFPLAAPSANPFGYVSPTTAQHVYDHFDGKIACILDGGSCGVGIESTIVGVEDETIVVYRLGGLSIEEIESKVGPVEVRNSSSKPKAPGMLIRHYAPSKKIEVIEDQAALDAVQDTSTAAYILFRLRKHAEQGRIVSLSQNQDSKEAAQNFYQALRHWDADDLVETIYIERLPDYELGRAINDRLRRAAN